MAGDTKARILESALELFAEKGYSGTSMRDIAKRLGITKAALYKHYASKQEIFEAVMQDTAQRYERFADQIDIHMHNAPQDFPVFTEISADALVEKVRQIFSYSLHDEANRLFRRMMTIEQFRSPELSARYSQRYVAQIQNYHKGLFQRMIAAGVMVDEDPDLLAMMYDSPILILLGECDRHPEKEQQIMGTLEDHVRLFYQTFHQEGGGEHD